MLLKGIRIFEFKRICQLAALCILLLTLIGMIGGVSVPRDALAVLVQQDKPNAEKGRVMTIQPGNIIEATSVAQGRAGMELDTNRMGGDYTVFDLQRDDPGLCRDACDNDPKCKAWTYVKPNVQGPRPRCWLKSVVPQPKADTCCVSGVKTSTKPPTPTPADLPQEITVAPGTAWEGVLPTANVLELMARIAGEKAAGGNYGLDVSVNGQRLSAPLINKGRSFRFADGRTFSYYDGSVPGWLLFYSPDFTANDTSSGGGYQVITDAGQAYRYRWDISSLAGTSQTIRLRLYNNARTSGKAIIVRLSGAVIAPSPIPIGSGLPKPDNFYYDLALKLVRALAEGNDAIITQSGTSNFIQSYRSKDAADFRRQLNEFAYTEVIHRSNQLESGSRITTMLVLTNKVGRRLTVAIVFEGEKIDQCVAKWGVQ
jgi:hypothetical protein